VLVSSFKVVASEKGVLLFRETFVSGAVKRRSQKPDPTFLQTGRHALRSFNKDRLMTDENSTEAEQSEWSGAHSMYCFTPSENQHNCIIARNK
jgi:hypothetical protein